MSAARMKTCAWISLMQLLALLQTVQMRPQQSCLPLAWTAGG